MTRKTFQRVATRSVGFMALWLLASAQLCTKVVTYGATNYTTPVEHRYSADMATVTRQTQRALETLGYEVLSVDESRNRITAGWKPTTSDSHHFLLFDRQDFSAATGSYYQLIADLVQDGSVVRVSLSTAVQSVAGKLSSSKVEENRVLTRLDDYLRSPQILMTNVGVQNR